MKVCISVWGLLMGCVYQTWAQNPAPNLTAPSLLSVPTSSDGGASLLYQQCLSQAASNPQAALLTASDASIGMPERGGLHCRAEAYLNMGAFAQAAQAFELLIDVEDFASQSDSGFAISQAAFAWQQAGENNRALELVSLWTQLDSLNQEAWVQKAALEAQMGRGDAALSSLDQGLEFLPQAGSLHVYRATALRRLGRLEAAREALLAAQANAETDPGLYGLELGLYEAARENYAAAAQAWRALIAERPDSAEALVAQRYLQQLEMNTTSE